MLHFNHFSWNYFLFFITIFYYYLFTSPFHIISSPYFIYTVANCLYHSDRNMWCLHLQESYINKRRVLSLTIISNHLAIPCLFLLHFLAMNLLIIVFRIGSIIFIYITFIKTSALTVNKKVIELCYFWMLVFFDTILIHPVNNVWNSSFVLYV